MKTLNDPVPLDDENADDWTPGKGLIRAAVWGTITALLLGTVLGCVGYFVPAMLGLVTYGKPYAIGPAAVRLGWLVVLAFFRAAIAFGVAWMLFAVVQRAAGMAGAPCTALAVSLAALVLLSNHAVLAVWGASAANALPAGWAFWFAPRMLVVPCGSGLLGITICALLDRSE